MNKTILMGRLTKDPEVKYLQDENSTAMARYTLAVDRRYRKDGKAETDFISCYRGCQVNCVSFFILPYFSGLLYR